MAEILTREEFEAQFHRANGRAAEEALYAHDAALRAEIERLREALLDYGQHAPVCRFAPMFKKSCDCGFAEVQALAEKESKP